MMPTIVHLTAYLVGGHRMARRCPRQHQKDISLKGFFNMAPNDPDKEPRPQHANPYSPHCTILVAPPGKQESHVPDHFKDGASRNYDELQMSL